MIAVMVTIFRCITLFFQMLASSSPALRKKAAALLPEENRRGRCGAIAEESQLEKTETEDVSKSSQNGPFVRSYRGKGGSAVSGGYRMSMTIRPQTVANLASKFDTIVKEQPPVSNQTGSQGIKLRTYDITKMISQLNKLNNVGDQSSVKSKPQSRKNAQFETGKGRAVAGSGGTSEDTARGETSVSGETALWPQACH